MIFATISKGNTTPRMSSATPNINNRNGVKNLIRTTNMKHSDLVLVEILVVPSRRRHL